MALSWLDLVWNIRGNSKKNTILLYSNLTLKCIPRVFLKSLKMIILRIWLDPEYEPDVECAGEVRSDDDSDGKII